jgi:hypothetical protein
MSSSARSFSPIALLWFDQTDNHGKLNLPQNQIPLRPTEGSFLRVRAAKTAPDGRPKRVFNRQHESQYSRMDQPKRIF